MSVRKSLAVDTGTTFNVHVRVKNEAGAAVDLEGRTATLNIHYRGDREPFYSLEVEGGADGWLHFTVDSDTTADWSEGNRSYGIDLHNADETDTRLLYGRLVVRGVDS